MVPGIATHVAAKSFRKRKKNTCPECGRDIHDPDCAFYEKSR